jgi:hypothetical protein
MGRGRDADNADGGALFLDGAGNAADEAASADGDDDGLEVGHLLQQLQADGALSGDDGVVIEGVEEDEAFGVAAAAGFIDGFVEIVAVEDDFGSVVAGRGDFDQRREDGHADLRADAVLGGVIGDGLGMIAGGGGDDAAGAFVRGHGEDSVESAALLKGACHVEIFHLQIERVVGVA